MNEFLKVIQNVIKSNVGDSTPIMVCLWLFPEEDFPAYQEVYGDDAVESYAELRRRVEGTAEMMRNAGYVVRVSRAPVADLQRVLAEQGWPNNRKNRTHAVGLLPAA